MEAERIIESVGTAIDLAGVVVIVVGAVLGTGHFGYRLQHNQPFAQAYQLYRQGLGQSILLGLEFLVASDIIRTVAVTPTFQSVGVLAAIVLVRTFLSFSLEVELEGRWPWQSQREGPPDTAGTPKIGELRD